jgi:hypothetical protein
MIQEIIEKIEKLPFAGRVTCVDFRTGEEHFIPTDDLKALAAQLSAANELEWLVGQMEYVQLQGDILIDVRDGEGFVVILNPDDDNRDVVGAFDTLPEAIQAAKEVSGRRIYE